MGAGYTKHKLENINRAVCIEYFPQHNNNALMMQVTPVTRFLSHCKDIHLFSQIVINVNSIRVRGCGLLGCGFFEPVAAFGA